MSPVRSVRSVPPVERTPMELAPLVETFPTVTVAVCPAVFIVTPFAKVPPVVTTLTADALGAGTKVNAPPVDVNLIPGTPVVEMGPVPEYVIVAGVVVLTTTRPGAGAVVVPGLAVPVRTVAGPSTQVMLAPVCEQVVACACAVAGKRNVNIAVETLLSNATRAVEIFILILFLRKKFLNINQLKLVNASKYRALSELSF